MRDTIMSLVAIATVLLGLGVLGHGEEPGERAQARSSAAWFRGAKYGSLAPRILTLRWCRVRRSSGRGSDRPHSSPGVSVERLASCSVSSKTQSRALDLGSFTVEDKQFYLSVAEIFERWVTRCSSRHTQRAYRQDVMDFVEFLGVRWPDEAVRLFTVSVRDVLAFRDLMLEESKAPKTINRRIASLPSFYKYLQGVASEFRLPITVPNPAHAQFIPRGSSDPRDETKALSATRARQLMGLPAGDTVLVFRDRAIIKFFLYTGARIGTGCRLRVKDFHQDGDEATITVHEKGDKHRRIGLHFAAAEAIGEYVKKAELKKGPLFRAGGTRASRNSVKSRCVSSPCTT